MLHLKCRGLSVSFARPSDFLSRWLSSHTARAIEADIVCIGGADDLLIVGIGDDGRVYPRNGGIVEERAAFPVAALVAGSEITQAVIDTAIVADVRPPISGMPNVPLPLIPQ